MSKDLAFDLFARVDIPYEYYKDLKDTWEYQEYLSLQKIYKKSDRELYKQSPEWIEANKHLKDIESKYKQVFLSRQKGIMVASEDGEELELPEVNYGSGSVILRPIK